MQFISSLKYSLLTLFEIFLINLMSIYVHDLLNNIVFIIFFYNIVYKFNNFVLVNLVVINKRVST